MKINTKPNLVEKSDLYSRIATLNPAEVLFLLERDTFTELDFMKFTLADLILKKALKIEVVQRRPHPKDPIEYTYIEVSRGVNFNFYRSKYYEREFLNQISEGKIMYLNIYLNAVFTELPLMNGLKRQILNHSKLRPFFSKLVLSRMTRNYYLNPKGKALKTTIEKVLKDAGAGIPQLTNQPDELFELVEFLGGNIFFIPTLDQHVWNSICSSVAKRTKPEQKLNLSNSSLGFLDETYYTSDVFRKISIFFFNMDRFTHSDGWSFEDVLI